MDGNDADGFNNGWQEHDEWDEHPQDSLEVNEGDIMNTAAEGLLHTDFMLISTVEPFNIAHCLLLQITTAITVTPLHLLLGIPLYSISQFCLVVMCVIMLVTVLGNDRDSADSRTVSPGQQSTGIAGRHGTVKKNINRYVVVC